MQPKWPCLDSTVPYSYENMQFSLHSNNIVSLDIYFKDMSFDVIEQTPVFESWTLIGKLR